MSHEASVSSSTPAPATSGATGPESMVPTEKPFPARVKPSSNGDVEASLEVRSEAWAGPIPPPRALAEFNKIDSSFADRILRMAEAQQRHEHESEKSVIGLIRSAQRHEQGLKSRGQWFGFLSVVLGLGASVYLGFRGLQTAAAVVGGSTVVALATVFVIGRKLQQQRAAHPQSPERAPDEPTHAEAE